MTREVGMTHDSPFDLSFDLYISPDIISSHLRLCTPQMKRLFRYKNKQRIREDNESRAKK